MGKHHKKSKRQRSEASAEDGPHDAGAMLGPPSAPLVLKPEQRHDGDSSGERKRKHQEVAGQAMSSETLAQESATKKRKRKKSKKKKKTKPSDDETVELTEQYPTDDIEESESSSPLEGSMVGDIMVLIDRTKGVVFSTTDRDEHGARKQVGIVKDGKIQLTMNDVAANEGTSTANENEDDISSFPFETDPDDHCESPMQAYQDIVPFLKSCGKKVPSALQIYDPYYCNGAVRRNIESLGFPNVYNKKEDCYQVWETPNRYPAFDIMVTNPPYSADHIAKLVKHISSSSFGERPWLLLLPQWVHKKDYYLKCTSHIQPFYLVPKKRYVYLPPPAFRQAKKSDVHKKSSPFVSMWYIWGGTAAQNERWLTLAQKISNCDVARSKSALRDLRRKGQKK